MNIVDSSGWLAYFSDEPNAKRFLAPLNDTASLVVPTVTISDFENIPEVKYFPKK